uniref:EGF-like domain-containing protein n=1 Tax=Amphimedon queenslandica TaxID=400682 RepID=A0A1X7SFP3_AMPQE
MCSNTNGSYECICNSGYEVADDNQTCIDIDECSSNSSLCGGNTCINTAGSYQCSCRPGCVNDQNDPQICIDIDECADNYCNQNCVNLDCSSGRYECLCNAGYQLAPDNHTCIVPTHHYVVGIHVSTLLDHISVAVD